MTAHDESQVAIVRENPAEPENALSDGVETASVHLAARLLEASQSQISHAEKSNAAQLDRMMHDAAGKAFTFAMVDEVFRSHRPEVQASSWRAMLDDYGVPQFFSAIDRGLLRLAARVSRFAPAFVMPLIEKRMRADSARVILNGDSDRLRKHVQRRSQEGFRLNLNHLGEAVLGEQEANRRLEAVLQLIAQPHVNYVSVKISAIFSQINLLAWGNTLEQIKQRLRLLYRAAAHSDCFVNLDMEEYRDLELTLAAFCQVLDEKEFRSLAAGIVLQAYLPDSWDAQQRLVAWSRERVSAGSPPVKLRLVKGANLAMESVEAELHGWNAAPYASKAETDANFRRMLEFGCQQENASVVRLGVASHNLFDVALALVLRDDRQTRDLVEIEMLEGMANQQARVVRDTAGGLLLYAPTVQDQDFLSAMSYLVRRLDENTAPENFLHDLFGLTPGSRKWSQQQQWFLDGWRNRHEVSSESRRSQPHPVRQDDGFQNEPDSDWTQPRIRAALDTAIAGYQRPELPQVPDVDEVHGRAAAAASEWRNTTIAERAEILERAATIMSQGRMETLACLRAEGKKTVAEADAEVSEAVDFANYYARSFRIPDGIAATPLGVVVVTPPWNFPYAIPCGGVLAALMAGNAVVLKPAPEVKHIAWRLVRQLWEAGVPDNVLQFVPCDDGPDGKALLTDSRVDAIVLTGAWQTARMFQQWRPDISLFAETSGKNAMLITARSDREQAVRDLVRSAFFHSGQKCSAASLAIIEAEVYDDPVFQRQLVDAAKSLAVGPATDPVSVITPVIQTPTEVLMRGLTQLDDGEAWLLQPAQPTDDTCLWTPGIRMHVQPGSWFHQNECFGPVLGLMRAPDLEQGIAWQNDTCYGLTAGLQSLDFHEQQIWTDRVQAGNLYINRPITGAIVQRQPFGGWKRSSIGPGAKAGGPNYVSLFSRMTDAAQAESDDECLRVARNSYATAWQDHFSQLHDPSALRCESNVFRYRPCRGVLLRLAEARDADIQRAELAARTCGVHLEISLREQESDEAFANRLSAAAGEFEFLRTVDTPARVSRDASAAGH
jgi:RHH-type proline utilization regulon transcriptional repressor/proline dehydrogenase/delta 1-pyrroline-5-carboxylate dehydrogenase